MAVLLSSFAPRNELTDWEIALHLANDDIERCHLIAQDHEGVSGSSLNGGERWAELERELATDRCARIQRETCYMLPCTEERVSRTHSDTCPPCTTLLTCI